MFSRRQNLYNKRLRSSQELKELALSARAELDNEVFSLVPLDLHPWELPTPMQAYRAYSLTMARSSTLAANIMTENVILAQTNGRTADKLDLYVGDLVRHCRRQVTLIKDSRQTKLQPVYNQVGKLAADIRQPLWRPSESVGTDTSVEAAHMRAVISTSKALAPIASELIDKSRHNTPDRYRDVPDILQKELDTSYKVVLEADIKRNDSPSDMGATRFRWLTIEALTSNQIIFEAALGSVMPELRFIIPSND